MSHCPSELLKESDVVLREQMAEDLRAGSPSQAVKTGSWKGNSKANTCVSVFSERQDRRCGGQRGVQREAAWKTVSIPHLCHSAAGWHQTLTPYTFLPSTWEELSQQGSPAGNKIICRKPQRVLSALSVVAVII